MESHKQHRHRRQGSWAWKELAAALDHEQAIGKQLIPMVLKTRSGEASESRNSSQRREECCHRC
jgi:hypothetical protein